MWAEEPDSGGVQVSVTDDFELRYRIIDERLPDPDDVPVLNYIEQVNRINARAGTGPWSLEVQVDEVALFANRYYLDDVLQTERELVVDGVANFMPASTDAYLNVEKVRLQYEKPLASIVLGDTYAAFGRGLALNINRNVDIDVDTSIQGAKTVIRPGPWDITAVAGQLNRQQVFQDNPNEEIFGDFRHAMGGLRVERFGLGPANLGVHGVLIDFVGTPGLEGGFEDLSGPDALVGGATAEVAALGADWYVEADLFAFPTEELPTTVPGAADKPGYGVYASSALYPGSFVVLVEGKRYFQAERINARLGPEDYEVGVAPTLEYERAVTEDSSATVNSNDIWGGKVRLDWAAKPGELVPYVAVAVFRDDDLGGLHFNTVPETVVHPTIGVEYIRSEAAALINAGVRIDDRDGSDAGTDRQVHGDAAVKVVPGGLQVDVALGVEVYQWGVNPFQQTDYTEVESGVTLSRGPLAFTWFTDVTTNPLVDSEGNLDENLYGAAELQVKPASALTVKALYGAQKAGLRCSGGQCRQLPGFEGVRFSLVGTF